MNQNETVNVTGWILASNEKTNQDNNIDVLRSVSNFSVSKVVALIMLSNEMPTQPDPDEAYSFKNPQIISIISSKDNSTGSESNYHKLYRYSWNFGKNETSQNETNDNSTEDAAR